MSEDNKGDSNGSLEIKTPFVSGKFTGKRMAEYISVLALCALVGIGMALWNHKEEARASSLGMTEAFHQMVEVQRQMLQAQREQNCLIAMRPDERNADFCRRITK